MKKENYLKLKSFFSNHQKLKRLTEVLYKVLPFIMFIIYPYEVIYNGIYSTTLSFVLSIAVAGGALLLSEILRTAINRPRPYEKFATESLIKKDKTGKSFPSNHSVCAFVIAMTGFSVSNALGIALIITATLIALTRIFSGVHFISDVAAGVLLGVAAGSVFLFI